MINNMHPIISNTIDEISLKQIFGSSFLYRQKEFIIINGIDKIPIPIWIDHRIRYFVEHMHTNFSCSS